MACAAGGSNWGVPIGTWGRLHSSWSSADRRFPSIGPLGKSAYGHNCRGTLKMFPLPFNFCPQYPEAERYLEDDGEGEQSAHQTPPTPQVLWSWSWWAETSWRDAKGGTEGEMGIVSMEHAWRYYQRKGKAISYLKLINFNYAEKIVLLRKSQKRQVKKKPRLK